jgi:hypothetical protein
MAYPSRKKQHSPFNGMAARATAHISNTPRGDAESTKTFVSLCIRGTGIYSFFVNNKPCAEDTGPIFSNDESRRCVVAYRS